MDPLPELPVSLTRQIVIRAPRALVFRYFTDAERFATWWGKGSTIDGRVGGTLKIVYPNGLTASGSVVEIDAPRRIVFRYGYDYPDALISPGGSRVSIELADHDNGTLLTLRHDVADVNIRDQHIPGWRYQLAVFANVASREAHADAEKIVDHWFAAWNESDPTQRARRLSEVTDERVEFADAHACVTGRDDLVAHIDAVSKFMPGVRIERSSSVRQCQGTWLADWTTKRADGMPQGSGTNVFESTPEGRLVRVVGFWA